MWLKKLKNNCAFPLNIDWIISLVFRQKSKLDSLFSFWQPALTSGGLYYKTFYDRNLRIFILS